MVVEPILVVMAAGMGSRFGGMKQIAPVGPNGEIIMDYSVYDAKKAGFGKVIFVIKRDKEQEFRDLIGDRINQHIEVAYAYQDLSDVPQGFSVPEGRVKPWGTGHAVLAARDLIDAPFAVINADDFYGFHAYRAMYEFLSSVKENKVHPFSMVGFVLKNTLTENGSVARGICNTEGDRLVSIVERTKIQRNDGVVQYTDDGVNWCDIDENSTCSMNLFGFTQAMVGELEGAFKTFMSSLADKEPVSLADREPNSLADRDPMKAEFFLPTEVNNLLESGGASVKVMKSEDKWYGMTYAEDRAVVSAAINELIRDGAYPEKLD